MILKILAILFILLVLFPLLLFNTLLLIALVYREKLESPDYTPTKEEWRNDL